jgi:hypothetical protein
MQTTNELSTTFNTLRRNMLNVVDNSFSQEYAGTSHRPPLRLPPALRYPASP